MLGRMAKEYPEAMIFHGDAHYIFSQVLDSPSNYELWIMSTVNLLADCQSRSMHGVGIFSVVSQGLIDSKALGRPCGGYFGLARLYEHGANPGTTHVVGTEGHLALELPTTGKTSTKSDVFTFGALLLEDVSGRRSLSPRPP
ncbi:hypothetical protein Vadar_023278 [Vaccinium darrowii]|uniref:Uncharacterized protein n=1 Tax=Vaccinium darrowii TaxID=229202 RepID=A0ACB7ZL05_9ERIC|nr:hypothetical protein Vadar_023278 [Vaccinium darrowii]